MHCKETFKMMLPVRIRADSVWSSCMLQKRVSFSHHRTESMKSEFDGVAGKSFQSKGWLHKDPGHVMHTVTVTRAGLMVSPTMV